jgi:hypothetical protein
MPDDKMDPVEISKWETGATTEEQDLAVWLCQASGDDPGAGRWKLFLGQARMFLAFRKWEAEQD